MVAAVPVGLLLGFAGPFGSYPAFPTVTRYAFWLGLTAAGAIAAVASEAVLRHRGIRDGAIRIGAVALLSALPMTFVVAWAMSLIQPGRIYAPAQLFGLFWGVAAVQLLVAFVTSATAPAPAPTDAGSAGGAPARPEARAVAELEAPLTATSVPATFPPALVDRLPPGIGRNILALETEDHYLRVHAAGGNALVLMRMADAVALLDPRLGAQVHRRWWVAKAAVADLRTEGQKLFLRLTDGRLVPVGRTFAAAVRARFGDVRNCDRVAAAVGAPGVRGT